MDYLPKIHFKIKFIVLCVHILSHSVECFYFSPSLFCYVKSSELRGWKYNIAGRVFALNTANLWLIPGIPYSPMNTARSNSEVQLHE